MGGTEALKCSFHPTGISILLKMFLFAMVRLSRRGAGGGTGSARLRDAPVHAGGHVWHRPRSLPRLIPLYFISFNVLHFSFKNRRAFLKLNPWKRSSQGKPRGEGEQDLPHPLGCCVHHREHPVSQQRDVPSLPPPRSPPSSLRLLAEGLCFSRSFCGRWSRQRWWLWKRKEMLVRARPKSCSGPRDGGGMAAAAAPHRQQSHRPPLCFL